ncbi:MAG: DUF4838 domain-containing protein, partial [Lentisphaerae bacterium]
MTVIKDWIQSVGMRIFLLVCQIGLASEPGESWEDLAPVNLKPLPGGKPVCLVENGQPRGRIIVRGESSPGMKNKMRWRHPWRRQVVEELQEVIKLATGAELPLSFDERIAGPALVIGELPESRVLSEADERAERFEVSVRNNRVYILGRTNWPDWGRYSSTAHFDSVVWGVLDFMERFLGVRWFFPKDLGGRVIPRRRNLLVPAIMYEDYPRFRMRAGDLCWARGMWGDWAIRQRLGMSWPYRLQCHTPHWGKIPGFREKHPECFMLGANGKRHETMLCYGHPSTLRIYLQQIEKILQVRTKTPAKEWPRVWRQQFRNYVVIYGNSITVSPADLGIACQCEYCRNLYEPEKGRYGEASRLMGMFVSRLAAEVHRRWPGIMVSYLPYLNYTMAPEGVTIPPNVQVELCGMPGFALYKDSWIKAPFQRNIDEWYRLTGRKVLTWEYVCWPADRTQALYQYPHVLQDYYRTNTGKIAGSFLNGQWGMRHVLTGYCAYRLLWNPQCNVDAIIHMWAKMLFGTAAGAMERFVRLQAQRWEKVQWSKPKVTQSVIYRESFPAHILAQLREALDQARRLARGNPETLRRIEAVGGPFADCEEEAQAFLSGTGLPILHAKK